MDSGKVKSLTPALSKREGKAQQRVVDYDEVERMAGELLPLEEALRAARGTDGEVAAQEELKAAIGKLNKVLEGF